MLKLTGITKQYIVGDAAVDALRGVDIAFRKNEFVSILGPSGCGKTTLLNIIGGLDRYTDGDLSINGTSTKQFTDADWDTYRNHSIGFVFQSYNLIPHQSVLSNVELALTLSGVSKAERRRRAAEVLARVGLAEQLHKRPNQLSGGQMQRVAIARALVNNPEILLADEPTGALDSETSVQIMDLLKEISQDKLVIMVTHNPDLAEQYSTRIVRLLDGLITADTDPFVEETPEELPVKKERTRRKKQRGTSMSFWTALSLSTNNLLTKKGRTFMTSFAGSIGIIGIALIMSLSSGFQDYIDRVQTETLSSYPLTLESQTSDMSEMMAAMMAMEGEELDHALDKVYTNDSMTELMKALVEGRTNNDLTEFKHYLEKNEEMKQYVSDVQYIYNLDLQIFKSDTSDGVVQTNPNKVLQEMVGEQSTQMMAVSPMAPSSNVWQELLGNQELLDSQYDVVRGRWPEAYNEVVLVMDKNNEVNEISLYALGLKDQDELRTMMQSFIKGETFETEDVSFTYEEILDLNLKLVLNSDYFQYDETTKQWVDRSESELYLKELVEQGEEIKVVGIIRPSEEAVATPMTGAIGYTHALTEWVIKEIQKSEIVKLQQADQTVDIFTGRAFPTDEETVYTMADVQAYIQTLPPEEQMKMGAMLQGMPEEQILAMFTDRMNELKPKTTYEQNLQTLGVVDLDSPYRINLYPVDFESKDEIKAIIDAYNQQKTDAGNKSQEIKYTDYIGLMMSSISTIINVISYVLIAFVAISLVVSSIMIGIITYISVLERTKEIGILRAMGASKRDISRVFNAETLIVGLIAGALGIGVTLLLLIPINLIIEALSGIVNVAALPIDGAVALIVISMLLTVIAGLIPSRVAAKKDPVVALRTE